MIRRNQKTMTCEILENRTLLSGAHAAVKEHAHRRELAAAVRREAAAAVHMAVVDATTSPVTGGGLFSVGPVPATSDVQSLQQAAISNNTVMFLTQLGALSSTNATIQQEAGSILNDARNLDLAMWNLANSLGVNLPADIEGSDTSIAAQAATSVNSSTFDQALLGALNQAGTGLASQLQQMATGAQTASIRSFATTALPIVQADLAAAQASASGTGTSTLAPVSTVPSSTTLGGADLPTLELSYSMNLDERFLAQFTTLVSSNVRVQQYNAKLINDHEMMAVQEGMYAAATGTYLPATITGMNIPMTTMLLNASGSSRYDRMYLKQMVAMHTTDLDANNQTLANAQNPVLRTFAAVAAATDVVHRQGASLLLRGFVR